MTLAIFLKLIHVLAAFWIVIGLAGRNITLAQARQAVDIRDLSTLMPLVNIFDRRMVIPGSSAVLLAGLLTALSQGWPLFGVFQGVRSGWLLLSLLLFLTTIPLVIFVFVPSGKVFEAAYNRAVAEGRITEELVSAFRNPAVKAARTYEIVVVGLIIALMVLKPF
jgi:hypothetical protein